MSSYCTKCGKELDEGTRYCPMCGCDTMAQGGGNNYQGGGYGSNYGATSSSPQYNSNQSSSLGGTLMIIFIFGIIWTLVALMLGLLMMVGGGAISSMGYEGEGAAAIGIGLVFLLAAIFTILTCMGIHKRENYNNTFMMFLIGVILSFIVGFLFMGILGLAVGVLGIVFLVLMTKEQSSFRA